MNESVSNTSSGSKAKVSKMKAFIAPIFSDARYALLGGCAAIVVLGAVALPRPDPADRLDADVVQVEPAIDLSRYDIALEEPLPMARRNMALAIRSGDSLGPLLQKTGLSGVEAYRITEAFSTVFNPRKVRVGQTFNLMFEDDVLTDLTFKPSVDQTIFVKKSGEDYRAKAVNAELKMDQLAARGTIKNSLYLDTNQLGVPDKVIQQFANIYEYSVDFQRDIQPGDAFEMFFEVARDHRGDIIKAGDLLFTSFSPRGKTSEYYLYEKSDGRENFYDADGKTAKRKLRATPVNGARLSSRFGSRRHPIKGYRRMHKGVDFAAPRGTPILAAGTGVVERANRFGTYGNYIRIRHSDGYKTAYAHLKGFARGIRKGKRVRQDQVIGYIGSTGASTGPHLHYEVIHNGRHINPRRLAQLSGTPLKASEMPDFKKRRASLDAQRANATTLTDTPEIQPSEAITLSVDAGAQPDTAPQSVATPE